MYHLPVKPVPPLPLPHVVGPERGGLRPQRVPLLNQVSDASVGVVAQEGRRLAANQCPGVPAVLLWWYSIN